MVPHRISYPVSIPPTAVQMNDIPTVHLFTDCSSTNHICYCKITILYACLHYATNYLLSNEFLIGIDGDLAQLVERVLSMHEVWRSIRQFSMILLQNHATKVRKREVLVLAGTSLFLLYKIQYQQKIYFFETN